MCGLKAGSGGPYGLLLASLVTAPSLSPSWAVGLPGLQREVGWVRAHEAFFVGVILASFWELLLELQHCLDLGNGHLVAALRGLGPALLVSSVWSRDPMHQ